MIELTIEQRQGVVQAIYWMAHDIHRPKPAVTRDIQRMWLVQIKDAFGINHDRPAAIEEWANTPPYGELIQKEES